MPADGSDFPESRFVVAETLVRFDHGAGVAEVLAGEPEDVARKLAEPLVTAEEGVADAGRCAASRLSRATRTWSGSARTTSEPVTPIR